MAVTARNIIRRSLLQIGAITKNEEVSADEASDGLIALNAMLGTWSNDSLLVTARFLEAFPLIVNQIQYEIGSGSANFDTVRPNQIVSAYIRWQGTDYPLGRIADEVYDEAISQKEFGFLPDVYTYTASFPIGIIKVFPRPSTAMNIYLRSEKPLTRLTSLNTEVSLPDGWEEAMVYNLAMRLAPEYGQPATNEVVMNAANTLLGLRHSVARQRTMNTPPLVQTGAYNIFAGRYL
jgi:hypothetical protein